MDGFIQSIANSTCRLNFASTIYRILATKTIIVHGRPLPNIHERRQFQIAISQSSWTKNYRNHLRLDFLLDGPLEYKVIQSHLSCCKDNSNSDFNNA